MRTKWNQIYVFQFLLNSFYYPHSLMCNKLVQTVVLFARDFTQSWLNSYYYYCLLYLAFILTKNLEAEVSLTRLLENSIAITCCLCIRLFVFSSCLLLLVYDPSKPSLMCICVVYIVYTFSPVAFASITFSLSNFFIFVILVFEAYIFHVEWY